eukprot:gene13480-biopygen1995
MTKTAPKAPGNLNFDTWNPENPGNAMPGGTGNARATPAPCPRHARATPSQKNPTARGTPAPCQRHARATVLFPQE